MLNATQNQMLARAMVSVAGSVPRLYGPDGRLVVPSSGFSLSRAAARQTGSMKNWLPKRLAGRHGEARERERIVERSMDLCQSDPHAAGIVDSTAVTVVGSGLTPHPVLDPDVLDLDQDTVRQLQIKQRAAYLSWVRFADAGDRLTFGAIQFLVLRSFLQYGEYLVLLPMIQDASRPFFPGLPGDPSPEAENARGQA